jgi:hypothetical protein
MFKILAISALAALAQCGTVEAGAWPALHLFTTFKTDASLFTWDGSKLAPYKDITATVKVDAGRNKVKIDAKVSLPLVGKVDAEVLADLTEGIAYEYIPFLGLCQKTPLNVTLQLSDVLAKVYSPDGGITTFDGESTAPWDNTKMYKFHGQGPDAVVTAFFDESKENGKWIQEAPTDPKNPALVASIPNGEVQATFADSDFVINGCSKFETERRINIWA